jgi:type II secretory pathway pseudopilin PulG
MMITLMLAFALIAIGLLAALPEIGQQIKRDREEEMRHRGTAYMRAIQHFYKKTGRYPTRLEELENTNNIRFLRKRYKDPLSTDPETGKERDFKLLHMTDINLGNGPVIGAMAGMAAAQAGMQNPQGMQGQGGMSAVQGALGAMAAMGGMQQQTNLNSSNSNLNPSANGDSDSDTNGKSTGSGQANSNSSNTNGSSSSGFNGPTFGGGPILGVASTSKEKSIRVFYQKNHYKDWLFVYMPMADQGGLLKGPINPGMPTGGNLNGNAGQSVAGQNASGQGSGFGQSSAFGGQSSGFGQSSGQGFGQGQGQGQGGLGNQGQQNSSNPQQ